MKFGTYMHYILENIDLKSKNIDFVPNEYKEKIKIFINNDLFNDLTDSKIYKEYEFIYEKDNYIYHGIIDLMIKHNDHVDIIDYKLKNIDDDSYIKQLNGYKEFIEKKYNQNANIYLYSIMNNEIKKLN